LVLTKFKGKKPLGSTPMAVDLALGGAISQSMRTSGFAGDVGESTVVDRGESGMRLSPRYVLLVGLGNRQCFDCVALAEVLESILKQAANLRVDSIALPVLMKPIPRRSVPNLRTVVRLLNFVQEKLCGREDGCGKVTKFTLLCRPQALRFLETACAT
jgi:hypothetical protein